MKPLWWTCGCGARNCSRDLGTPVCGSCEKPAKFTVRPPEGQGGFAFAAPQDEAWDVLARRAERRGDNGRGN